MSKALHLILICLMSLDSIVLKKLDNLYYKRFKSIANLNQSTQLTIKHTSRKYKVSSVRI